MKRVTLGKCGMEVSQLCLGTTLFGRKWLNLGEDAATGIVRRALELGVNFIDTTEDPWTHRVIRQALAGADEDVVLMTRSFANDYEQMEKALYGSVKDLGREAVDIFLMHGVTDPDDKADRGWAWRAIRDFAEAGAVRASGISTWAVPGIMSALMGNDIEVIMAPLNKEGLGLYGGPAEDAIAALSQLSDRGVGVVATRAIGGGFLADQAQQAIEYVRSQPFVDAVHVNVRSIEELEAMVHLFSDEPVPAELQQAIEEQPRKLHVLDWCTLCEKCVEACPEGALSLGGWLHKEVKVDHDKCARHGQCARVCPVASLRFF